MRSLDAAGCGVLEFRRWLAYLAVFTLASVFTLLYSSQNQNMVNVRSILPLP